MYGDLYFGGAGGFTIKINTIHLIGPYLLLSLRITQRK